MSASRKLTALLPMKANSQRVKGKNFRSFAGKPLYRWILDTLLQIDRIDLIVVNTDARERLAETGLLESDRVLIRDRRPEICGDHVSMNRIIEDDLQNVASDHYLMTHVTNPLLTTTTISDAIDAFQQGLENENRDSLFTVNRIQSRFYSADGTAINHDPKNLIRTQDLEPWFEENSNLYLFSKASFAATNARIGENPILFPTPMEESIDIDEYWGWNLAESVALRKLAQYQETMST